MRHYIWHLVPWLVLEDKKPRHYFLQLVPWLVGQEQKINTTLPLIARDLQVLRSE